MRYCYNYIYRKKTNEIATDLTTREWGCTRSLEDCKAGCENGSCNATCCYGDVNFANDSSLNFTEYKKCIYGGSGGTGLRADLWAAGLACVVLIRHIIGNDGR